jgi:hypothetical protein
VTSDCAGCRFFARGRRVPSPNRAMGAVMDPWTAEPQLYGYGECRIRSVPESGFPRRSLDDWCGEWQEREEPRMDDK